MTLSWQGVLSDKKIQKSLLGKIVSSVSDSVSTFMGTPQRNDNLNFDNSETSLVASVQILLIFKPHPKQIKT